MNFNEPWPYYIVYGEKEWILPLNSAIVFNSQECIDFLLEHNATPDTDGVFHQVVLRGNTTLAEKLLNHGADVNAIAPQGMFTANNEPYTPFPLYLAVDFNNYNDTMLKLLLDQPSININQELPNRSGVTALTSEHLISLNFTQPHLSTIIPIKLIN